MTNNLTLLLIGLGLLGGAILPRFLRRTPVSLPMPMLYLGGGMLLPFLWADIPRIDLIVVLVANVWAIIQTVWRFHPTCMPHCKPSTVRTSQ